MIVMKAEWIESTWTWKENTFSCCYGQNMLMNCSFSLYFDMLWEKSLSLALKNLLITEILMH